MRALIIVFALLLSHVSHAERSVGVLVTGDYLKTPTQQQAEKWLRAHEHKVVTSPMPPDAVKTLLDCFVLDDPQCTRGVVEARASTPSLVSIRIDVASKKKREIRVTVDWFNKGHSPVSARRTCDGCTEAVLRETIDAILDDLSKTAPGFTGKLKITSKPPGLMVLLDNQTIGVTPLERDVKIGSHTLRAVRDGRTGEEVSITVDGGETRDVTLPAPPAAATRPIDAPTPPAGAPARRSRLVPGLLIGIGLAGVGAGAALYLTSEESTGQNRTYRDTKNLGIGVAAGGGALLLTGVIVILATKSSSTPTVALTPGGATVGWAGRF